MVSNEEKKNIWNHDVVFTFPFGAYIWLSHWPEMV